MAERGKRLDDLLDLLETWWTRDLVTHEGVGYTIAESHVDLKPVRKPPVHLAGFGEKALRRVARRADGWLPVWSVPEQFPTDVLTTTLAKIRADAEQAGRDPRALGVALRVNAAPDTKPELIAESVTKIVSVLEPDHTFVDISYLTRSVEEHIDLTGRLLDLTARG
jgi:alkanesulfonate monooxygenase SsuD/methylene tetrahydromethanopterin reductase-like flavin-dependent oxidoreductase (luciferase family)